VLLDPLAAVIALASLAGLVVSARSLQVSRAVPVIAVTSVAANVVTIAAGPVVFEEPLPGSAWRSPFVSSPSRSSSLRPR
jgi:hypothetical protein